MRLDKMVILHFSKAIFILGTGVNTVPAYLKECMPARLERGEI